MGPMSEQLWEYESRALNARTGVVYAAMRLAAEGEDVSNLGLLHEAVKELKEAQAAINSMEDAQFISDAMREGRLLFKELAEKYSRPVLICLCSEFRKQDHSLWWVRSDESTQTGVPMVRADQARCL